MSLAFKIAVIGDSFMDIQAGPVNELLQWNKCLSAPNIKTIVGGSACNTARYLGCLGVQTRFFSAVGDDKFGRTIRSALENAKNVDIDKSLVTVNGSASASVVLVYGSDNGEQKHACLSNLGSLSAFDTKAIDKKVLLAYDHLHFGGYFVCSALHTKEFVELVKEAKGKGMTVSMDCQYAQDGEWQGANGHLDSILPLLDVFMPCEVEAFGITKTETVRDAIRVLADKMPKALVMVKNGKNGVFYVLPNGKKEIEKIDAFDADKIVDTTGAGGSFNAGFIREWAKKKSNDSADVASAIKYGCATATLVIQQFGPFIATVNTEKVEGVLNGRRS